MPIDPFNENYDPNAYIRLVIDKVVKANLKFNLNYNRSSKKVIPLLAKRLPKVTVDNIVTIRNIFEKVYPNRVDMQFVFEASFKPANNIYGRAYDSNKVYNIFDKIPIKTVTLIVHFPIVIIKNSNGESLELKDLFIKVPIKIDKFGIIDGIEKPLGARTTLSAAEYTSKYLHSHLHSLDPSPPVRPRDRNIDVDRNPGPCQYGVFCTGGEGYINIVAAQINDGLMEKEDIDSSLVMLYALNLQNFVEWESLEGVPYMRLNNVIQSQVRVELPSIHTSTLYDILRYIKSMTRIPPNLDWEFSYDTHKYKIIDNRSLENYLLSFPLSRTFGIEDYFYKNESGYYLLPYEVGEQGFIQSHNYWLPFKGEKVHFKIEGGSKKIINPKKYIHPQIKQHVKREFEQIANYTILKEAGIRRLNSYHYT